MTLTIKLPPESESKLRRQAAAAGRDVSEYAAQIVQDAIEEEVAPRVPPIDPSKLQQAVRELLQRSADLASTLTGPVITDPKKAWGEIMDEKARKQGLQL